MDEKIIVSVFLYDKETYYLTVESIYAKWSSSLSDVQFFSNTSEARKILELNFDKICNSLGNNPRFVNKIKISTIVILDNKDNYEILSEEYFIGGLKKDE